MKFKEEVCGNCGLDLTTAEPVRVREMPSGVEGKMVFMGQCPQCNATHVLVAPEPEPVPEPEPEPTPEPEPEPPVVRTGRRRVSEPEAPPEEPGAEEKPSEKSEPEE